MTPDHNKKHCVYAATSRNVTGPYELGTTTANAMMACDLVSGGCIDPTTFIDAANSTTHAIRYLVFKQDGNADDDAFWKTTQCRISAKALVSTPLLIQPMDSISGLKSLGKPRVLFENIASDGPGIEGPALFWDSGYYYLLFNTGCYQDQSYSVLCATCKGDNVLACKWQRARSALLWSGQTIGGTQLQAPGGVSVQWYLNGQGRRAWRMVFHADVNVAWFARPGKQSQGPRVRGLYAAELTVGNGTLALGKLY